LEDNGSIHQMTNGDSLIVLEKRRYAPKSSFNTNVKFLP